MLLWNIGGLQNIQKKHSHYVFKIYNECYPIIVFDVHITQFFFIVDVLNVHRTFRNNSLINFKNAKDEFNP